VTALDLHHGMFAGSCTRAGMEEDEDEDNDDHRYVVYVRLDALSSCSSSAEGGDVASRASSQASSQANGHITIFVPSALLLQARACPAPPSWGWR
jgi:hypothetical protein